VLTVPLLLEFGWGEIAQRGIDTLVHVNLVEEAPHLAVGIIVVEVLWQVNFLLLDRSDETFSVAVLPGFAHVSYTDLEILWTDST